MLLDNNSKKVIALLKMYSELKNTDKIRLAIYILENKNFSINFNIKNILILLNEVLVNLDEGKTDTITNFSKYTNLLFLSAKYLELNTY